MLNLSRSMMREGPNMTSISSNKLHDLIEEERRALEDQDKT